MRKHIIKALSLAILLQSAVLVPEVNAIKTIKGKKYFSYMVQKDETAANLMAAFKITEEELYAQNPNARNGLSEKMVLLIPVKEGMMNDNLPEISVITYKVKPGDTLFSLAKDYNSTIEDIIQRNIEALSDGILRAGSIIKIAKNSGGLTGGEEAKQAREKAEQEAKKLAEYNLKLSKADSVAKAHAAYWSQPWTIIDVQQPGTIHDAKTELEWRGITRLKVTGTINETDAEVVGKRIFEFDRISALDMHEAVGMKKVSTKDFEECSSLRALALPNSIDSIGVYAFIGSDNLEVLRCYSTTPPACSEHSFDGIDQKNCTLEVPKASIEVYKATPLWSDFETIKAIPTAGDTDIK